MSRGRSDELVTSLLTASRALVGVSAASLASVEQQVTLVQFRTLVVLSQQPHSTVGAVAARLGINPSSAQRQIDRLVSAGLASREENPADRREVVVALTATGQRIVEDVTRARRKALTAIVRGMPADQYESLITALDAFAIAAGEPSADDAAGLGW
ncbi:MarR family winged helix-turn-helix transcriptional regulator [Branchiibius sp. NY16-3462-2]|uniref:MarR family winged helix-turn-helix transcriptional regulator n=1 Tax=Branchiibius sp. NY16-3462-2 TaxID=1807500 RepID=UPI00079762F1|nr:MarR family winged helix-turn-helix transcriptional regulator [Branchiibius sp. NY16-3462-2]KYH44457.1 hypothetical protein AZH51_08030 [Branchiibius sp. NY16-3462-2]